MAQFLVELYVQAAASSAAVAAGSRRARDAAADLRREGFTVDFIRSLYLPRDETCYYLFEAPSEEVARQAAERAGLTIDRVIPAESVDG